MNLKNTILKFLILLCFTNSVVLAQNTDLPIEVIPAEPMIAQLFTPNETLDPAITKDVLSTANYFDLHQKQFAELLAERPQQLILTLPINENKTIKIALEQQQILTDNFQLRASHTKAAIDYQPGLYYQGEIVGEGKTFAAISILRDYVMGVFSLNGENYVLGHLRPDVYPASDKYVLYQESNLLITNPFECSDLPVPYNPTDSFTIEHNEKNNAGAANSVKVYFEADHDLYNKKGGTTNGATDYVTGLFNIVNALYNAENIATEISEIYVWTGSDPYPSNSSSNALNAFRSRLNGNFNGDVAHLLSIDDANNGGVAYVDVLCVKSYAVAYSDIGTNYNNNPVPTYSWTTEVVTHEMGHNLGSPHTQSCSWPGGAIDNCVPVEGGCSPGPTPTNGGTIMSYCHLTNIGINYANGFGPLPGDKIRSEVTAASCLTPDTGGGGSGGNGGGGDNGGGNTGTPNLTRNTANLSINGSTVSVDLSVINNGDGDAAASQIRYFLTTDNQISSADPVLGAKSLPALTAGSSSNTINLTVDVASLNIAPATYYVAYIIDPNDEVTESNEGDNAFWWNDAPVTVSSADYCSSTGESTAYEYISYVQVGDYVSDTGDDDGYAMRSMNGSLPIGNPLSVDLRPGYYSSAYREYWRIWIDLNQDNDFSDAGELVFDSGNAYSNRVTGNLIIPATALTGTTRMRVSMRGSTSFSAPNRCGNFDYGEVEDYEISLQSSGLLPIQLVDFTGSVEEDYNLIQWTTATEEATVFHYLERSVDGKTDFKTIAQLTAAGNSNTEQFYQVKDAAPLRRAYYRLRTENIDGSEDFSKVLFLEQNDSKALEINRLYPIPAHDQLTVEWSIPTSEEVQIRLFDFTGKMVQQRSFITNAGVQILQLEVAELTAGIYFITMEQQGQVVSQKVSIQ